MDANNQYANARIVLNDAMGQFIQAAEKVGKGAQEIAEDVNDSLCDASNREIMFANTDIL